MTAEPAKKSPQSKLSDNTAWARGCGASRFNPALPDQAKVLRFKPWPLVIRLRGWMEVHTSEWPRISPYAVGDDKGTELHIEHAAYDLGDLLPECQCGKGCEPYACTKAKRKPVDMAYMRRAWRWGVRMGWWGNQQHPSGTPRDNYHGKRRMYLYGAIDLAKSEQEAGKPELELHNPLTRSQDCTVLFGHHIWLQIKDRPQDEIENMISEEETEREIARDLLADTVAATRWYITQRKHSRHLRWGVKPHDKKEYEYQNGHAADYSERQDLVRDHYAPALAPLLESAVGKRTVQSSQGTVHDQEDASYSEGREQCTHPLSLLGQNPSEKPRLERRSVGSGNHSGSSETPPVEDRSDCNLQYTDQEQPANGPEEPQAEFTPEQKNAVNLLFEQTREFQLQFPNTRFGKPLVNPEDKGDVAWALRVLEKVGAMEMGEFIDEVKERIGLGTRDRRDVSRDCRPDLNKGKRFVGLFVEWAHTWHADAQNREAERLRVKQLEEERDRRANELNTAAAAQQERWKNVEQLWKDMPNDRKATLINQAKANIRADPQWSRSYSAMSPQQKQDLVERQAMKILEKVESVGGVS